MSGTKIMVTVKEFAAMTGIGQNRVRELCYLSDFPASKEGNRFLIHVQAASDWLRNRAEAKVGVDVANLKHVVP